MALFAPMICFVICRIFHEANPKSAKLQRLPPGSSGFSLVFGFFDGGPVDALEGDFHGNFILGIERKKEKVGPPYSKCEVKNEKVLNGKGDSRKMRYGRFFMTFFVSLFD